MDAFEFLPDALRLIRRFRRLSQAEGAERAGMKSAQLSKYETGKIVPELRQLSRLLAGYGATLSDLAMILDALRDPQRVLVAAGGADEIRDSGGTILLREGGMLVPTVAHHLLGEILARLNQLIDTVREVEMGRALRSGLDDPEDRSPPTTPSSRRSGPRGRSL